MDSGRATDELLNWEVCSFLNHSAIRELTDGDETTQTERESVFSFNLSLPLREDCVYVEERDREGEGEIRIIIEIRLWF